MCYNAYHLSLALNAIFSFLIIICSTLLFSGEFIPITITYLIIVPTKVVYNVIVLLIL